MAVTNIIDAIQQYYAGLTTWTGKPATLWFGTAWPRDASGNAVSYPVIRFTHLGNETDTDFEYTPIEQWPFRFEIFADSVQNCLLHFDHMRFNGADPSAQTGFWYASTVSMPAGHTFMSLEPRGQWRVDTVDGQFSPAGYPTAKLTFEMVLHVQRSTYA